MRRPILHTVIFLVLFVGLFFCLGNKYVRRWMIRETKECLTNPMFYVMLLILAIGVITFLTMMSMLKAQWVLL